jgi:hypothetical protein
MTGPATPDISASEHPAETHPPVTHPAQTEVRPDGQNTATDLAVLRQRLLEHSPLEDLGPLFAPEAQGENSSPHL